MKKYFAKIILTLLVLTACEQHEIDPDQPVDQQPAISAEKEGAFLEAIAVGNDTDLTQIGSAAADTTEFSNPETVIENGQEFNCRKATVSLESAPEEFVLYDPNSDVIFPGNLIQGKTINNATPEPIPIPRGAGRIVMTSVNGAESVSRLIDEVTLDEVYDAQNQIINENSGNLAARLTITMEQVYSSQHLDFMLQLKGEFDALFTSGSVSSSLQFSQDREYNRFLVKLNQSFYTMAYRLPQSYSEVFGEGVTPDDLAQYVQPDNPATFISSVTYGRIFYLLFESTSSREEMNAALNATFSGSVVSGEVGAEVNQVNQLKNVKIKAYALGGEAGDALRAVGAVQQSSSDLINFLADAGTIETGAPISYVIRSLKNPTKIVRTGLNTSFEITHCENLVPQLNKKLFWFNYNFYDDSGEGNDCFGYPFKYISKIKNQFEDKFDLSRSGFEDQGAKLIEDTRTNFYYVFNDNCGEFIEKTYYSYPGSIFKNTDYTIFITLPLWNVNNSKMFFNGNSAYLEGLEIGFRKDNEGKKEVYFTHQNGEVTSATIEFESDNTNIIALVFSQSKGMKIFIDGVLAKENPSDLAKEALVNNLGASIGHLPYEGSDGQSAFMDLRGYGVTATDDQVKAITTQLQLELGL